MQQLKSIPVADLVRAAIRLARSGRGRTAVNATGVDRALWIAARNHHSAGSQIVQLPRTIVERAEELNQ